MIGLGESVYKRMLDSAQEAGGEIPVVRERLGGSVSAFRVLVEECLETTENGVHQGLTDLQAMLQKPRVIRSPKLVEKMDLRVNEGGDWSFRVLGEKSFLQQVVIPDSVESCLSEEQRNDLALYGALREVVFWKALSERPRSEIHMAIEDDYYPSDLPDNVDAQIDLSMARVRECLEAV